MPLESLQVVGSLVDSGVVTGQRSTIHCVSIGSFVIEVGVLLF